MDSYGGSLSYSQITELRRKVAVCFNLDLGASLQQKLSWKLSLIKSKLLCKWPEKKKIVIIIIIIIVGPKEIKITNCARPMSPELQFHPSSGTKIPRLCREV